MEARSRIRHSVSFTTRTPRQGERHGEDYCFISAAEFRERRLAGEFLEWAEVHGNFYATPRDPAEKAMAEGRDMLFDIDWQGAKQLKEKMRGDIVSIFIAPPSLEILKERLQGRGKDAPEVIERRLAAARNELEHAGEFQYIIVNQDFTEACQQLLCIADAARCRFRQQAALQPRLFAALGIPSE